MKKRLRALAGLLVFSASAAHAQQPFSGAVVFGDSASDNGNGTITASQPISRFTTNPGLTAVEYVALHYGYALTPSLNGGTNYAYAGAGVVHQAPPTLVAQKNTYLASVGTIDAGTLIQFRGGGNDSFYHLGQIGVTETLAQAKIAMYAIGEVAADAVLDLRANGAETVVAYDVADVGRYPGIVSFGATVASNGTALVQSFNAGLDAAFAGETGIVRVDLFKLTQEVFGSPATYGFVNVTNSGCTVTSRLCTSATLTAPGAEQTYFFADGVHVTTGAHQLIADLVISELSAPGQMSLLAETPLSVAVQQRDTIADALSQAEPGLLFFGDWRQIDERFSSSTLNPQAEGNNGAMTVGVLKSSEGGVSLGGALTAAIADADLGAFGAFTTRDVSLALFGGLRFGEGGYLSGGVEAGALKFKTDRSFAIGAAKRTEFGETEGSVLGANLRAGWRFALGPVRTGPFAAIGAQRVSVNGFAEEGDASSSMFFRAQEREQTIGELGWEAQAEFGGDGLRFTPYARASHNTDSSAGARSVSAGVNGMNGEFAMPAYVPDDEWTSVSAGLAVAFTPGWSAQLDYSGRRGDGDERQEAEAIRLGFSGKL